MDSVENIMYTIQCRVCKEYIQISATPSQVQAWKEGLLIQKAMPNVPADERELLISGICGSCFDEMFQEDND